MNFEEQYNYLIWGVDQIITKNDFKEKLSLSIKENRPLKVKLGVDPTAPDIHLGHTVVLRKLRHFQDLGHEAILIIGDFTSQIGDPSGKTKTRPALTPEEVKKNADTYLEQVKKILLTERLTVVNNSDWLDKIALKDLIKLLSLGTMSKILEHNTFKERFNDSSSIRMHEFIYPFLQAYDSIHLKADCELGGTDQLFNIAFGRELQKECGQSPQSALLMPILTGTDGSMKMSKSLNNYVGVNESPSVMRQKLLNMPDKNIIPYFKLLTSLKPEEVNDIELMLIDNPSTENIIDVKNKLINEIINIYHPLISHNQSDIFEVPLSQTQNGILNIVEALKIVNFTKSNRESIQFIKDKAVKVNNEMIIDRDFNITLNEHDVELKLGKKKIITLKLKK